jgi:hypothetical protein
LTEGPVPASFFGQFIPVSAGDFPFDSGREKDY